MHQHSGKPIVWVSYNLLEVKHCADVIYLGIEHEALDKKLKEILV